MDYDLNILSCFRESSCKKYRTYNSAYKGKNGGLFFPVQPNYHISTRDNGSFVERITTLKAYRFNISDDSLFVNAPAAQADVMNSITKTKCFVNILRNRKNKRAHMGT